MKLSTAYPSFLALAGAALPLGYGSNEPGYGSNEPNIGSCFDQSKCFHFTITEIPNELCQKEKCEYEICLWTNFDQRNCPKPVESDLDHVCKKKMDQCWPTGGGGFGKGKAFPLFEVPTFRKHCQHVVPGGKAEWLVMDGEGCQNSGSRVDLGSGLLAECHPRPPTVASCTDEEPRKECWWRIKAPSDCPTHGGMMGDPHIMRWNGKRLSYHGECDLVMIHSPEFAEGKGLDLHIRTTIDKFYSFVDSMALKIGHDILEMSSEEVYFNKIKQAVLPSRISGYRITETVEGANRVIRIDLHHGDRIEIKVYKQFLSINVAARAPDFGNSVGLLGDFYTGSMLARDGKTVIELDDEFGAEWQVRSDEPKLFHDSRAPQLPEESCRMPSISAARGLKGQNADLKKAAEEACSSKDPDAFDFCVFDVLATGDIGMAGAW